MRRLRISPDDLWVIEWWSTVRWPNGPVCLYCNSKQNTFIASRGFYQCNSCRKQFGVLTGTKFEGTRLSPKKLLDGMLVLCSIWGDSRMTSRRSYNYKGPSISKFWILWKEEFQYPVGWATAHRLYTKLVSCIESRPHYPPDRPKGVDPYSVEIEELVILILNS